MLVSWWETPTLWFVKQLCMPSMRTLCILSKALVIYRPLNTLLIRTQQYPERLIVRPHILLTFLCHLRSWFRERTLFSTIPNYMNQCITLMVLSPRLTSDWDVSAQGMVVVVIVVNSSFCVNSTLALLIMFENFSPVIGNFCITIFLVNAKPFAWYPLAKTTQFSLLYCFKAILVCIFGCVNCVCEC